MIALKILVGLARAVRRQIGNTGLGGCNRRPLEKSTDFKFCLFGAARKTLSLETSSTITLRLTKVQNTYLFSQKNFLIFFILVLNL